MNYNDFIRTFSTTGLIESAAVQFQFDEPEKQIQVRLSQWVSQKKLIQLRRGKYILPQELSGLPVSHYYIANYLYRPSYASLYTALEYYDTIPETVHEIQSVSTRQTANWNTPIGRFSYKSVKPERFWGFVEQNDRLSKQKFFMAAPEKALLDLFYFHKGEWTVERIREMRFQNVYFLDLARLVKWMDKMNSPKIFRAVNNFLNVVSEMELEL